MKSKFFILILTVIGFTWTFFVVVAQEDDDVRGAFISTRPKTTSTTAPSHRHRPPRNANTSSTSAKNVNSGEMIAANANTGASGRKNISRVQPYAIGLGYTLFMRDANGRGVRVEPNREFHNGDRVRIALEPNVDSYLYVFHTEADGAPEMVYPDRRLDGGENWIEGHVPMEVPSSDEAEESLRWFTFYGSAGIERLYVVLTREPLRPVPTGEELIAFCTTNKDKCPWHPSPDVWKQIQDATKADVKVVTSKTFGQAQTEKEQVATTRGLGLDQSAPEPSVIRMNALTTAPMLVTVLDLIHK